MTIIGGKTRLKKPAQPQFVVQHKPGLNEYLVIRPEGLFWVGDKNAATKFDSKYAAKCRVRDLADIPDTRQIVVL